MSKATKRADKLAAFDAALDRSSRSAHAAIQKAEDALFKQADRLARRTEDQAASRASRGMGVSR